MQAGDNCGCLQVSTQLPHTKLCLRRPFVCAEGCGRGKDLSGPLWAVLAGHWHKLVSARRSTGATVIPLQQLNIPGAKGDSLTTANPTQHPREGCTMTPQIVPVAVAAAAAEAVVFGSASDVAWSSGELPSAQLWVVDCQCVLDV